MKMKNMKFLSLAAIFVTGSTMPMGSFGPSGDDFAILGGGLIGAGVVAVLGVQKGTVLAQPYKQSLGMLAEPIGGLLGGSVGFVVGSLAGMAATEITLTVTRSMSEKIKRIKAKIAIMKKQYYKTI